MRIDLHADTPLLMHWCGYDLCKPHKPTLPAGALISHVDVPRMQSAQLDAQLFGLVALPIEPRQYHTINAMIDALESAQARSQGAFRLVKSRSAWAEARASNARIGLLSIEGVHALDGQMARADELLARGVISFGLSHFHANAACRPAIGWGRDDNQGLTNFGFDLVAHLAAKGAILDLTHINRRGFDDAIAVAQGRVIVSHTGIRGVHDIWRNLDDQQIRAIASHGGLVGVIFSRQFLGGNTIEAVVDHIVHLVNVGGAECAALGSDFDGFIIPVRGLRDISGLDALRGALLHRGLSERTIDGIFGLNAQKFLEETLSAQRPTTPAHDEISNSV